MLAARGRAVAARSGRQGADGVERALPPRRSPKRQRHCAVLDWIGRRPWPTESSCCASYGVRTGRWHRSWQADGAAAGTPSRPSPPTTRRWSTRSSALGELTGEARWMHGRRRRPPTPCSTGSGTRSQGGLVHDRRRCRGAGRAARRTSTTMPLRRPTRSRPTRLMRLAALTGEPRLPQLTPIASCSSSRRSPRTSPAAVSNALIGRRTAACGGSSRSPSSATLPTSCRVAQHPVASGRGARGGASPTTHRCGKGARTGLRVPSAATTSATGRSTTPEELFEQITGKPGARRCRPSQSDIRNGRDR